MKKMTKISFIKGKKYIFTLGLTNLHLGFRVKEWGFGDRVSKFLKLKINIKNFKIKMGYFSHFLS